MNFVYGLSLGFVRVGEDQMPEPEGPSATPETTIISENRTKKKRKKDARKLVYLIKLLTDEQRLKVGRSWLIIYSIDLISSSAVLSMKNSLSFYHIPLQSSFFLSTRQNIKAETNLASKHKEMRNYVKIIKSHAVISHNLNSMIVNQKQRILHEC